MLDKIRSLEERYQELNKQLAEEAEDYTLVAELAKERSDLEPIILKGREYESKTNQLKEAIELHESADDEFRELAQKEIESQIGRAHV